MFQHDSNIVSQPASRHPIPAEDPVLHWFSDLSLYLTECAIKSASAFFIRQSFCS
jgi:hypothetical protein